MGNSTPRNRLQELMSELVTDSSVSLYVQNLLHRAPLLIQFRHDIEHCFLSKRTQEFSLIFRIASFLWLALYVAILLGAWLNFDYIFSDTGYVIWQSAFLVTGILLIAMNICAYIDKSHDFIHHHIVAPAATLVLYQLLVGIIAYRDGYANIHASYNIILTMIIAIFSLRLLWQKSAAVISCSALMAYATIFINDWTIPTLQSLHAFVLMAVVLLSISFFVERRERLGFINEVLVAVKSAELHKINSYLSTIAREDALSGLANRRAFDDCLANEWERARREEQPLSLLFIDIDHFKLYNDTYGHAAGDDCLRQIGHAMKKALLRPADSVARYGGEEFVILLPNTQANGGVKVAERVLTAVDNLLIPHIYSTASAHVSVSIGVTTVIASHSLTLAQVLKQADIAMYRAKSQGRHQFAVYEATTRDKSAIDSPSALVNPNF